MDMDELLALAAKIAKRHTVSDGKGFKLSKADPDDTGIFKESDKERSRELLAMSVEALSEMQDKLYAQDRWSLLLVIQAMDAAGKDGAIKQVMSGVNPQGCSVHSFKAPSAEELDHDFMWRSMKALPARGMIGIFNRSYYEEVLVVRVHRSILEAQKLPPQLVGKSIWDERYKDIRRFEEYLSRNGTVVRKIFLNVSKAEQKRRFLSRIDTPEKHWKFSESDVKERAHWDRYMEAYEDAIRNTATEDAPWSVIPADSKWYARLAISSVVIDALSGMDLHYPKVSKDRQAALASARAALMAE